MSKCDYVFIIMFVWFLMPYYVYLFHVYLCAFVTYIKHYVMLCLTYRSADASLACKWPSVQARSVVSPVLSRLAWNSWRARCTFVVAAGRQVPRGTRWSIAGSRPRTSSVNECRLAGNIRGGRSAERREISDTRNLSAARVHTNRQSQLKCVPAMRPLPTVTLYHPEPV